jgi:hypothetical protein
MFTPANNMRVQAVKGANLFWQYIVKMAIKASFLIVRILVRIL